MNILQYLYDFINLLKTNSFYTQFINATKGPYFESDRYDYPYPE